MSLSKLSSDLRRLSRPIGEAEAPAFRATRSEVERLIKALTNGSQVRPRVKAIVGPDEERIGQFLQRLETALQPLVADVIYGVGGKVSGAAASTVSTELRGMARAE